MCLGWSRRLQEPLRMPWREKLCSKQGNMGFCQALCVREDGLAYADLTLCTQGWPCVHGPRIKKTLMDLLKYKSSRLSPKPLPTYFQPREHYFEVPQWQKTLLLMPLLGLGSLVSISRIPLLSMVFLAFFSYHQIRVDETLLHTAANYWVSFQHVFHFSGIELCLTIEEFVAIMGEPEIDDLIFPTIGRDLPSLLWVVLGILFTIANRWCVFGKLNLKLVFEYFSHSTFHEGERPHLYFLRAFCLCAFARYFLVQNSYCVDFWMCMIAYELKRGNPMGLILAKTFIGFDAFHRKEANFFAESPLLLQV